MVVIFSVIYRCVLMVVLFQISDVNYDELSDLQVCY